MNQELRDAVETAYRVFGRYRLDGQIDVCHCNVCVDAETEHQLISTPLRDVPRFLLAQYTHSAHCWSALVADQLRYFLPRYFELIAMGEDPCFFGEALDRLANAAYRRDWPKAEADAIDAFFVALLRDRLNAPLPAATPAGSPLYDDACVSVLSLCAHAGADVRILLQAWDETRSRGADIRLADFVLAESWSQRRARMTCCQGQMAAVVQWLTRPQTRERLESAFLREADADVGSLLSRAEESLRAAPTM